MHLWNLKHDLIEKLRNFESRFEAQVATFNAGSDSSKFTASFTSLRLLARCNVESSQLIFVLAAAGPLSNIFSISTEEYLKAISCASVASVLRQCYHKKDGEQNVHQTPTLYAQNASTTSNSCSRRKYGKEKINPAEPSDLKMKTQSRICHKNGQWASEHNETGSLKPGGVVLEGFGSSQKQKKVCRATCCKGRTNVNNLHS